MPQCSPRVGSPVCLQKADPATPKNALQEGGEEPKQCREPEITKHRQVLHLGLPLPIELSEKKSDFASKNSPQLPPQQEHVPTRAPITKNSRLRTQVTMTNDRCQPRAPCTLLRLGHKWQGCSGKDTTSSKHLGHKSQQTLVAQRAQAEVQARHRDFCKEKEEGICSVCDSATGKM